MDNINEYIKAYKREFQRRYGINNKQRMNEQADNYYNSFSALTYTSEKDYKNIVCY